MSQPKPAVKQNVVIQHNGMEFKVQFEHCPTCKYFEGCYSEGKGPNYLDPDCATGHVE